MADQRGGRRAIRGKFKVFVGHHIKPNTGKNHDNTWLWLQKITFSHDVLRLLLRQTEFTLWLPRMIYNNLFCYASSSRLTLLERGIHTCSLLASFSLQFSLILSLATGLLVNRVRVDTQRDGSCPSVSIH